VPASIAAVLALAATLGLRAEATSPAQRIGADVERLASAELQGRRAGTEGGDRAAAWIAGRFQALGLAPGGDRGSYLQEFTFIDGVSLGPGNRLATSVAGAPRSWKVGEDFRPLAFSSAGSVSAGVVFAGYGIVAPDLGYDDYEGIQVTDRVVLVLRYGPGGNDTQSRWAAFTPLRMKAAAARDRGAKALLIVTGPGTPEAKDELVPLRADASLSDSGLPVFSVRRPVAEALFAGSRTTLETAQRGSTTRPGPRPRSWPRAWRRRPTSPRVLHGSGEAQARFGRLVVAARNRERVRVQRVIKNVRYVRRPGTRLVAMLLP